MVWLRDRQDPDDRGKDRRDRDEQLDRTPRLVLVAARERQTASDEDEPDTGQHQGQTVVDLGRRDEPWQVVAGRRQGREDRLERVGQDEQPLDQREQDRPKEEDRCPGRGIRMSGQQGGREEDGDDRGEERERVDHEIGDRRARRETRRDDEVDQVAEGQQDEDPGDPVETADRQRFARFAPVESRGFAVPVGSCIRAGSSVGSGVNRPRASGVGCPEERVSGEAARIRREPAEAVQRPCPRGGIRRARDRTRAAHAIEIARRRRMHHRRRRTRRGPAAGRARGSSGAARRRHGPPRDRPARGRRTAAAGRHPAR